MSSTLFRDHVQQMPIAPDSNRVFVPKAPAEGSHADQVYAKFVSTIDKTILDQSSDAMNALLKKTHVLIGGDKNKEQFTMRGHLDSLELCLNDMVTELKYHQQQVQILSAEKDTAGALLEMGLVQARNNCLNEEHKIRQELQREDAQIGRMYEKLQRQLDAVTADHNTANARVLALQRRVWDSEGSLGIAQEPWGNKVAAEL
jgi:hypothetical protein